MIVIKNSEAEFIVDKSRFIAYLLAVNSENEAKDLLNETRKKYHNATHVCYAYRIANIERSSDDGEPSGTAGMPLLLFLKNKDLDNVLDASSLKKEIVPGYHVCEAVVLTKKEKQPISLYSKIYSCKSENFISMNKYTKDSIDKVRSVLNRKCNMIFDRGYDDNKIIDYVDKNEDYFVIRINDDRTFYFKNKKRKCYDVAIRRKGKVKMTLWFDDNEKRDVYVSHTKVVLPYNKKDYELVIVYGLSEERPLILLTNRSIKNKEDVIRVVRLYFYRWRVEEYFRAKKQEYEFENIRVRTLKSMNNLNLLLTIHMGHIGKLAESIDKKLLVIKIIEKSKSLRSMVLIWLSQIARGIGKILSYAHTGIKEYQKIEKREKYKQLEFRL